MREEYQTGYNDGFKSGYEVGFREGLYQERTQHPPYKTKVTDIHDPGQIDNVEDVESIYEQSYGHAVYRSMKKSHEFK
jgi:hypothetical protein